MIDGNLLKNWIKFDNLNLKIEMTPPDEEVFKIIGLKLFARDEYFESFDTFEATVKPTTDYFI
jgi:hypothetical protein